MGYTYRGTQLDAHLPWPDNRGKKVTVGPAKCGTRSGYARHLRLKEDPCQDCRLAKNAYDRDYTQRTKYRTAGA